MKLQVPAARVLPRQACSFPKLHLPQQILKELAVGKIHEEICIPVLVV